MVTNAARPQGGTAKTGEIATPAGMILYNYGLKDDGSGAYMLHHETHPCPPIVECTEASMVRKEDTKRTIYEFMFPAHAIGVDAFTPDFTFGLGTCINDGDTAASQDGQGGWSGWSPCGTARRQAG